MPPARPSANSRRGHSSTIGTPYEAIQAWAQSAELDRPLALFCTAVSLRTDTQQALFAGTIGTLESLAPVLRRWDLNGSPTFGLARLANSWAHRPPHMSEFSRRVQHRARTSADFFATDIKEKRLDSSRDALFFLLEEAFPWGADQSIQQCLRAWLLVHAVRIAANEGRADQLVATVARFLAGASAETETRSRRDWLAPFGAPADTWEEVNDRFNSQSTGHIKPREGVAKPANQITSATARLALGQSLPFDADRKEPESPSMPPTEPSARITTAAGDLLEADDNVEIFDALADTAPSASSGGDELEDELTVIHVDPEATAAEHSLHLQSLQLRLGASARFVPWGTWDSLTPLELAALNAKVASALAQPADGSEQLLAAMVQIALQTGQTLDKVVHTPIVTGVANAVWQLDLGEGVLRRKPPRHQEHWQPRDDGLGSLSPPVDALVWSIGADTLAALKAAFNRCPAATFLGQLRPTSATSLRREFRAWVRTDQATNRIEGSFLASTLGQRVYDQTRDAVLSRLLGTAERQTLPASTGYAAYDVEAIDRALPGVRVDLQGNSPSQLNAAGSRMDLKDDDLIQSDFADALGQIIACQQRGNWIEFHNRVALHWDAALRAATGVRPVNDLWKSPLEFDWDAAQVYVDDKASPFGQTGRLVPLPRELCARFRADYIDRHIPWVLGRLAAAGSAPSELPSVLFILDPEGGRLTPVRVENRHRLTSNRRRLYEGALPLNVFRHRLRTRLHRSAGLDLEIVDTVMGHRDGATLTHGRYSMRVWRDDAEVIRPAMTAIFDAVGFWAPPLWEPQMPRGPTSLAWWPVSAPLGYQPTTRDASAAIDSAGALAQVQQYVQNESSLGRLEGVQSIGLDPADPRLRGALASDIARLNEDQVDELSQQLLRGAQRTPSLLGVARYEVLLQLVADAWTHLGLRVRMTKRYAGRNEEASPFTSLAARATGVCDAMKAKLEEQFRAAPSTKSRVGQLTALGLAVCDLALLGRLANRPLLDDVIQEDAHWRVVSACGACCLEWNPSADLRTQPDAPVLRFVITARSAWLLNHKVRGMTRDKNTRNVVATFAKAVSQTAYADLSLSQDAADRDPLGTIIQWVEQRNAVELPGSVAAYLGGRLMSPALPWGDWMKLKTGRWTVPSLGRTLSHGERAKQLSVPNKQLQELPGDAVDEIDLCAWTLYAPRSAAPPTVLPRCSRADEAYRLFAKVRESLNSLRADSAGARHRERMAEQLALFIEKHTGVASAIQLLSLWAIDLLLRPGRSRKLAVSSVLRYFGALSPRFQAMGYDVELHVMDEEEIASFYADVIASSSVDNAKDLYDGLRNFHLFAMAAAGLPPVDWSTLGVADTLSLGSPGWVDDDSYLELVHRLGGDQVLDDVSALQLQCIAILARRFGLRGAEVTGLRRSDVQWGTGIEAVIVRNTGERTLKTPASRRVVPLLYELSGIEQRALSQLIESHCVDTNRSTVAPLFYLHTEPDKPIDGIRARARINEHLKALTGQPSSTLHKLRKAFVIDLWTAIESPTKVPPALATSQDSVRAKIVETLLGPNAIGTPTRRGMWAVARAAGHAGPSSTIRSYAHVLSDVAASWVASDITRDTWSIRTDAVSAMQLDRDLTEFTPAVTPVRDHKRTQMTPLAAFRGLLHLAHGRSPSSVAEAVGLPFESVDALEAAAAIVYAKLDKPGRRAPARATPQRASRRLATQGLLTLVHVNAHARLRAGLVGLPPTALSALQALSPIPPNEWAAIVGARRKFSMWRREHFHLTAIACRHLVTSERLAIEIPVLKSDRAANRIHEMARAAGWLADPHLASGTQPALCRSAGIAAGSTSVELPEEGLTVDALMTMRLTNVCASDKVCDGFELAIALICLNACAQATPVAPPVA